MANGVPNSAKVMYAKGQIKNSDYLGTSASHTFKIILMASGFVFDKDAHHSYADVLAYEFGYPAALGTDVNGYTVGGTTLTGVGCVVDNVNDKAVTTWSDVTWTASGDITASGAIIYDDSTVGGTTDDYADAIISYKDAGGDIKAVFGTPIIFNSIKETIS